jgi:hypothetical protein
MNLHVSTMTADVTAMTDAELDSSIDYCQRWRPLFDGLPRGISLLDAALCKFARRDPLALEFMQSHVVTA